MVFFRRTCSNVLTVPQVIVVLVFDLLDPVVSCYLVLLIKRLSLLALSCMGLGLLGYLNLVAPLCLNVICS